MAKTSDDLEGYLNKLERHYQRLDDGTYLVALGPNQPAAALRVDPPVVVMQVEIGPVPSHDSLDTARLFRRLLELNSGLLHVAYALQNGTILLSSARELDTLDINELEAVFADTVLALTEHVPMLRQMATEGA
jgi:hypothetical protein